MQISQIFDTKYASCPATFYRGWTQLPSVLGTYLHEAAGYSGNSAGVHRGDSWQTTACLLPVAGLPRKSGGPEVRVSAGEVCAFEKRNAENTIENEKDEGGKTKVRQVE